MYVTASVVKNIPEEGDSNLKWIVAVCVVLAACAQQPAAPAETTEAPAVAPASPDQSSASPAETPAAPDAGAESTIVEMEPTPAIETSATHPPVTQAPAPPSTGTPVVSRDTNISIGDVTIGNPLIVTGRARTFENNVALRVRAADGTLITEGFTTANGDMGQHNPYRGTLWLTRNPGKRVIVEALEYSAKDGSERSLVRVERPFAVETVSARLSFPDRSCSGVKPYTRAIPKTISMARLLVEALIAGPTAAEKKSGAETPFPSGSRLESINLRGGTITVDFNERLQSVGGACRAQMIRAAVTATLRQLPTVKKVVITAGGSESQALQP
jgi:hypothetical protein